MNQVMKIFLLLSVGVMASQSISLFQLVPSNLYYGSYFSDLSIRCQEYSWDEKTSIVFFANGGVLFNSSSSKTTYPFDNPLVYALHGNRTVQLNSKANGEKGFTDVYCTVNGTKSSNKMTLPFINTPSFQASPTFLAFNKRNYTFECNGSISPKSDFTINFSFNSSTIASFDKGKMKTYGSSGLKIYQNGDHSIIVYPTQPNHNGTYGCSMDFNVPGNHMSTLYSAIWKSYYGL